MAPSFDKVVAVVWICPATICFQRLLLVISPADRNRQ